MKTKIIFSSLFCLFLRVDGYGQDYEFMLFQMQMQQQQMQMQQQVQALYNQVYNDYSYYSTDGKNLVCSLYLSRISGFPEASASITRIKGTTSDGSIISEGIELNIEYTSPSSISITAGGANWKLSYGDIIEVSLGNDPFVTFTVGGKFTSEAEWNSYAASQIKSTKNRLQNTAKTSSYRGVPPSGVNSFSIPAASSGRSAAQVQLDISKYQEQLNDCIRRRDETSSGVISTMYGSQIVSLRERLDQLQQELIRAR